MKKKIAIQIPTWEDYLRLGITDNGISKDMWNMYKSGTYINQEEAGQWMYCFKSWYEQNGYTLCSIDEYLKGNVMTNDELVQERLKEIDDLRIKFFNGNGKSLVQKFSMETFGVWQVYGEGDDRIGRFIGIYEGRLIDVVNTVVQAKGFFSWGAGGSIESIKFESVNEATILQRVKDTIEYEATLKRLKELEEKIQ